MAVDAVQQAMQGLDSAEQHANATRAAAGQVGLEHASHSIMHGPVRNNCKQLLKPVRSSGADPSTAALAPSSWPAKQACLAAIRQPGLDSWQGCFEPPDGMLSAVQFSMTPGASSPAQVVFLY